MKLRVDVGDVHAVTSLVCGVVAVLFTFTCLVDFWSTDTLVFSLIGVVLACYWTSLFGLVLRGTMFTRVTAGLGLVAGVLATCMGLTAIALR